MAQWTSGGLLGVQVTRLRISPQQAFWRNFEKEAIKFKTGSLSRKNIDFLDFGLSRKPEEPHRTTMQWMSIVCGSPFWHSYNALTRTVRWNIFSFIFQFIHGYLDKKKVRRSLSSEQTDSGGRTLCVIWGASLQRPTIDDIVSTVLPWNSLQFQNKIILRIGRSLNLRCAVPLAVKRVHVPHLRQINGNRWTTVTNYTGSAGPRYSNFQWSGGPPQ